MKDTGSIMLPHIGKIVFLGKNAKEDGDPSLGNRGGNGSEELFEQTSLFHYRFPPFSIAL